MIPTICDYELQAFQAKETIAILERKLCCIKKLLDENFDNAFLRRELTQVELEMTITVNELEHIEYLLQQSNAHEQTKPTFIGKFRQY